MASKQNIFETTLKSPYDASAFVDFIREMIVGVKLLSPGSEQKPYSASFSFYVSKYFHVGEYEDPEGDTIGIFAIELNRGESVENARSAQRAFVKTLLEKGGYAGALVAFYSTTSTGKKIDTWRFSFIRMDYDFAKGKIKETLTPAKRYSYLVGKGEPCHTAMDRLFPIFVDDNEAPTLDELEEAFSVETVTKEFFEQYKEKYLEMKEFLEGNDDFVEEAKTRGFTSEQFTKKLLAQIAFLYFVQKKGWLGVNAVPRQLTAPDFKRALHSRGAKSRALIGSLYVTSDESVYQLDMKKFRALSPQEEVFFSTIVKGQPWGTGPKDFMRHIFNDCVKRNKNFFDDYLEPLFYTGLNQNRGDDAYFLPLHCRIPFLNGGLFEELDNYDWQNNDFAIPNEMFSNAEVKGRDADGVLDIFDRYNFTMAEDEPMEREVAVDPEMLGKVFENLLEVKDRKSKGAFYTPREIVHYMCQESLINYLVTKSGIPDEDIRKLVLYGEYFKGSDVEKTLPIDNKTGKLLQGKELYKGGYHMELDKQKDFEIPETIFSYKKGVNRLAELDELLANVKVVDPSVGSGAFPLGLLNEIVKTRDTLSTYMAIEMNPAQKKSFYAPGFVGSRNTYDLKSETIRNCIFACDIEPSATDIAKLRLWLSLVIEDELSDSALDNGAFGEHSKPKQLPNLDCNIICGNSLVDSFESVDLISESDVLKNISGEHQENFLQAGVDNMITTLIALQDKLFYTTEHNEKEQIKAQIQSVYDSIIEEQLQTNPELLSEYRGRLNNTSRPFVIWQLYFPKVFRDNGGFDICIGNPPYGAELSKSIQDEYRKQYKEVQFKIDSYVLFIIKGLELSRYDGGVLSYIIPNTLLNNYFLGTLRETLINEYTITHLINFDNAVFDAVVHSLIIQVQNKKSLDNQIFTAWNLSEKIQMVNQLSYLENDNYAFELTGEGGALLSRLRKAEYKLEDILDLRQAIKSGNDKEYISSVPKGNAKKILRGKDVGRYSIKDPGLFLDYGKHLACPRDEEIFLKPHILIREAGKTITATIDYDNHYIMSSLYCGIMKSETVSIEYVMGLINSKLFQYLMYKINFENTPGAFTKAKIYHYNQLPFIVPPKALEQKIAECVETIIELGGNESKENEIDRMIYNIYELTESEIEEIENTEY